MKRRNIMRRDTAIALFVLTFSIAVPTKGYSQFWKELKKQVTTVVKEESKRIRSDAKTKSKQTVESVVQSGAELLLGTGTTSNTYENTSSAGATSTDYKTSGTTSASTASSLPAASSSQTGAGISSSNGSSSVSVSSTPDPDEISTADAKFGSLSFTTISMTNPMFRMLESGLILYKGGMSLVGEVVVNVKNYRGKRLVCLVEPIVDGHEMADNIGECTALYAFTPNSANCSSKIKFAIPYSWLGMSLNSKATDVKDVKIAVSLFDLNGKEEPLAARTFPVTEKEMNIDRGSLPYDMLGSLLGSGVSGDGVITCTACDGTGLCDSCYGDGYLNPSACRKCATNPGICRRCKGEGEEGVELDRGGSLFDLF